MKDQKPTHETFFDTFEEFIERGKQLRTSGGSLDRVSRHDKSYNNNEWTYGATYEDAVKLAEGGWEEGVNKIKTVVDLVTDILKPESHQQDLEYRNDGGSYVDVARALTGEPDCFGNFIPPENPQRPLKVVSNVFVSAGVDVETLIKRGAAIGAAIDVLESRGYMVEFEAVCCGTGTRSSHGLYAAHIPTKTMGQALDLDRIAFVLAHPAMFRRLCFAMGEMEAESTRKIFGFYDGGGYLHPATYRADDCDLLFQSATTSNDHLFETPELCAQWVKNTLAKANLVDFEDIDYL